MSVIFEGEYTSDSQEEPTSLYYALNLDLSTGEVLDLSGLVDPDELAATILAGGYTLSTASDDELYDGQKTYGVFDRRGAVCSAQGCQHLH